MSVAAGLAAILASGAAALWASAAAPARAATADLRETGRVIYAGNCARCHGNDGADTASYPGAKSLVDITQRLSAEEVIEKSKGFATVQLQGEDGRALVAHLETFRSGKWPNPELLVETGWVALRTKDATVRIVDLRSGEAYAAGHIPGAVRIAEGPLRDPNDPLDYLPRPEVFAEMMSKAGIGNPTQPSCVLSIYHAIASHSHHQGH